MQVVDPAVQGQPLAALPGPDQGRQAPQDADLFHHVQLAQPLPARVRVGERIQFPGVRLAEGADRGDPALQRIGRGRPEGRLDAPAAIVAGDDDVPDLQDVHRVLQDRQAVGIVGADDVGDVAVDEQLAGNQADDLVGRDPAVGAADPQVVGALERAQALEEVRVAPGMPQGPGPVVGEQLGKEAHAGSLTESRPAEADDAAIAPGW